MTTFNNDDSVSGSEKKAYLINIYKIVNTFDSMIYLGSTRKELWKRYDEHKEDYLNKKVGACKSAVLFETYGIENCMIKFVGNYWVHSRPEMFVWERFHHDILFEFCINKKKPMRTENEKIAERVLFEETRKLKYTDCECGGCYTYDNDNKHFQTIMHKTYIQNKNKNNNNFENINKTKTNVRYTSIEKLNSDLEKDLLNCN